MSPKRTRLALSVAVLACLSWVGQGDVRAQAKPAAGEIRVLPIRGNIYLLSGAGSNVVASVGKDGVLLVDSGTTEMSDKLLATVRELSRRVTASPAPMKSCVGAPQGCQWWSSSELLPATAGPRAPRPIIGIVNTSDDPDHVGGNAVLSAAGRAYGVRNIDNSVPGAYVVAHENVTRRVTKDGKQDLVASETYFGNEKKLNFVNGEGVVVTHPESAHTDGDSIVYFRGSDVVVAGDLLGTVGARRCRCCICGRNTSGSSATKPSSGSRKSWASTRSTFSRWSLFIQCSASNRPGKRISGSAARSVARWPEGWS